ncbi:MAG: hypothetical protein L6R40_003198 [Gallowayella cf. fulva]|nr:MAG: hypothetical protein L6R40_003198 [Xanthomendoza cf. fulva]
MSPVAAPRPSSGLPKGAQPESLHSQNICTKPVKPEPLQTQTPSNINSQYLKRIAAGLHVRSSFHDKILADSSKNPTEVWLSLAKNADLLWPEQLLFSPVLATIIQTASTIGVTAWLLEKEHTSMKAEMSSEFKSVRMEIAKTRMEAKEDTQRLYQHITTEITKTGLEAKDDTQMLYQHITTEITKTRIEAKEDTRSVQEALNIISARLEIIQENQIRAEFKQHLRCGSTEGWKDTAGNVSPRQQLDRCAADSRQ